MLRQAEELKRSDPLKSQSILSQLSKEEGLSEFFRDKIAFLNIYKLAIDGELESAVMSYKSLYETPLDVNIKFQVAHTIFNILGLTRDYYSAVYYLDEALKLLPQVTDQYIKNNGISVIMVFYNLIKQYEKTLTYGELLLSQTELTPRNLCIAYTEKIIALFHLNKLSKHDPFFQQGLDACLYTKEPDWIIRLNIYKAKLRIDTGEYQAAIQLLNEAKPYVLKNTPLSKSRYYAVLSQAYWHTKSLEQAEYYAHETLISAKAVTYAEPVMQSYEILYLIEKHKQNYELALDYLAEFMQVERAYRDEVNNSQMLFLQAQHDSALKDREIAKLAQTNKLLSLESSLTEESIKNRNLMITMLLMVVGLVSYLMIRFQNAKKHFRKQAQTDGLTGVSNRRYFYELGGQMVELSKNRQYVVSVILFDLDFFKKINDHYGHAVGDRVLKETTEVISNIIRKNDLFGRIGGEEFCILLQSCPIEKAAEFAKHCQQQLANIDTSKFAKDLSLSASFGISSVITSGYSIDKLVSDADTAMYRAKNQGRNRIEQHQPIQDLPLCLKS